MLRSKKDALIVLIVGSALLVSACGGQPKTDATISTAVAQTVEAQNAVPQPNAESTATLAALPAFTTTPPAFFPTITPAASKIPATLPSTPQSGAGKYLDCMKAGLTGETIPDGTVMKPGEQFTKVWQIQNNSNCTWDTNYKIVFWDGEILGGGFVYNFPQSAIPGQIIDVPLVLTAPAASGTYKSSWMFQTPDGANFGVGQYSQPIYTEIVVSDANNPKYGVLSVDYQIERDPVAGCPANVFYTVYATISVSGPMEVQYYWRQSDGNDSNPKIMKFTKAGSQTISREWSFHLGSSTTHDKWMQIVTVDPFHEYEKAVFRYDCN